MLWRFARAVFVSRAYIPVSTGILLVLTTGLGLTLLMRAGAWPPAFLRAQPAVIITQPQQPTTVSRAPQIRAAVLGAVRTPGVYAVSSDARVRDLVAQAGGLLSTADVQRVDLAAPLPSMDAVYVPHIGERLPPLANGKLDLNAASADDIRNATGISATTAKRIITYRSAHGPFTAVNQLLLVPVSRASYDRMADLVTV